MGGDPLGNFGFGHREETIRQMGKRLIFLRRTAHVASIVTLFALFAALASQQILQAQQASTEKQKNKADGQTDISTRPPQPASPTQVTVEGPITVVNQPDSTQEQKDAEHRAQTRFENGVQIGTLIFVGFAALGALGAYFANRRSAKAAETQVTVLKGQVADADRAAVQQQRIALDALAETRRTADAAHKALALATEQKEILAQQHQAIAEQAGHMLKGLRLTKATLKNTQKTDRAWVSLEDLVIAESPRSDGRLVIMTLRNSGRTPARILEANVTVRGSIAVTDGGGGSQISDLTDLPDDPQYESDTFVPPSILVAGEESRWRHVVKLTVVNPIDSWGFLTMKPGDDRKFWIFGFVRYTDVFNPNPKRAHTYRWGREYDPILSAKNGRFSFIYLPKPKYNKAD